MQWGPDAERTRRHAGGNANDALGRRVARTDTAGEVETANAFNYNLLSEVTNVVMGGTTYSYAYDPIGNRTESAVAVGNGQPDVAAYGANALNPYSAVTNSANSASPSETVPVYDADGNMTAYGPWTYTWDAENRMSSACSNNVMLVTNVYDHMSRRIGKEGYVWNSQASAYSLQSSASFLWDGWNVIREIVGGAGLAFTNYYTWGLDLSGTLQGAGGVGGLLAVTRVGPECQQPQVFYPCYDANGNVTAYLDATGAAVGAFEYDAFGNTVAENVNEGLHLPFRFSTKYRDAETGLCYYGYRYYHPELGRWVNRDPMEEESGINLFEFIGNDGCNECDVLGLSATKQIRPLPDRHHWKAEVVIEVGRCEIKVIYGHQFRSGKNQGRGIEKIRVIRAASTISPCAYAAVVGCYAEYVPNDEIPLPGYTPLGKFQQMHNPRGFNWAGKGQDPTPNDVIEGIKVLAAAKIAAKGMFDKPCCCPKVSYTVERYGMSHWNEDPKSFWPWVNDNWKSVPVTLHSKTFTRDNIDQQ